MKKIFTVAAKVMMGILLAYLFTSFVIIPLIAPWVIKSQATKILAHTVNIRSVSFDPFLWKVGAGHFEILDADKRVMIGFDRLDIDVSFISLLKKQYRVESVVLDGLRINAALLPGGKIDLLDLVPAAAADPQASSGAVAPASQAALPLPLVIVDEISFKRGCVRFLDRTIHPNFSFEITDIDVHLTGLSTQADAQARLVVGARLAGKGLVGMEAVLRPFSQPLALETTFKLDAFALDVLTPYVGKYTGRALKDGILEVKMDYRISDNRITAAHKVLIQRFEFGEKVESKDALPLPFGLAVALLEDPQGRIKISLPVTGDMSKPDFHYWSLVGQVIRNFFMGLVTKPFAFLASALGADSGTDELGYVRFLPGRSDMSDAQKEKIRLLLKGLKDRPKLKLEVNGAYDPSADWKEIKKDQLDKDYAELRKGSSRSDSWIYQMLYQRRVGVRDLWEMTRKFKLKDGSYDDDKLIAEIRRALIEDAPADKQALQALGRARAQGVYDFIMAEAFDTARVSIGQVREEQASMGFVPQEFTLTLFENGPSQESVDARQ